MMAHPAAACTEKCFAIALLAKSEFCSCFLGSCWKLSPSLHPSNTWGKGKRVKRENQSPPWAWEPSAVFCIASMQGAAKHNENSTWGPNKLIFFWKSISTKKSHFDILSWFNTHLVSLEARLSVFQTALPTYLCSRQDTVPPTPPGL